MTITKIVLPLIVAGALYAMPPQPEIWQRIEPDRRVSIEQVQADAEGRGLNRSDRGLQLHQRERIIRDDANEVILNIPVILVDFIDNVANHQVHSRDYYDQLIFSDGEVQTGSVRDFYFENSFENVIISGDVVGWYRAPQTYAYYTNRQYGLGNYPRNAQKLAEDAIQAADRDTDFSRFDNDGDGIVEAPFIVHAGGGAEQNPNNVNLIWSHAWNVENLGELDGVRFSGYTIVPEDGNIGVYSHELGHALFGLPDLYDTRGQSAGLGYWSVMSYGAWGDGGRRPVQFDSWCKAQLGWIDLEVIQWDRSQVLPSAESTGRAFRLQNPDNEAPEYFLAEYRDRSGFDGMLPAAGLLIYHVDERMENNDHPFYPGNQEDLHDLIALEQADNDYDLEQFENPGDAGDPFPGTSDNRTFDTESEPGSRNYTNEPTGIAVRNITVTENGVEAEWIVGVEGPPLFEQTCSLHSGWNLISLRVTPADLDVRAIVAPLVHQNVLRFVKDGSGRFYVPSRDFNNIPFWQVSEGYYFNLTENVDLTVEGEEVEFDRLINLRDGWQTISYFPEASIPVERAFADLDTALLIVKDDAGRFYYPRRGFSNMEHLSPGKGYWIKVVGQQEHRYPER